MAVLRSRRLQNLLGAPANSLTYQHLAGLAGSGVGEAADLDFKEELYGTSESNRRSLAVDVAAMANTLGGLILLGVTEDDQARADSVPGVILSDDEVSRMRQIVASQVMPMPAFEVSQLEDPATPGRGCLVVMVPPSPIAPHAVVIDKNSLRYPRRNGATTTYLSESDVAQAYRDRFTGLQSKVEATAGHEAYLLPLLDYDDDVYLVVSLVPDLDGHFDVDSDSFRQFQQALRGSQLGTFVHAQPEWHRFSVRSGRLLSDAMTDHSQPLLKGPACALHFTGAGTCALPLGYRERRQPWEESDTHGPEVWNIDDETLVDAALNALRFLATHARDRATTAGNASLRATIVTPSDARVVRLVHHRRDHGMPREHGRSRPTSPPVATTVADIDDLAADGTRLAAAVHLLTSGLVQEFGYPETLQVSRDGAVRRRYWRGEVWPRVDAWATQHGVEVSKDELPSA